MTTYSLFKTLLAPTGIENAVYCNFLNEKEHNLITTSANQLQVYKLNSNAEVAAAAASKKLKFECVQSFPLFGTISNIAKCRYGSMRKDALIVAFLDAKVSFIEYNELTGELNTLAMHYFEHEIEVEGNNFNVYNPLLRVDPNMRCAVMLIYGYKLAIIPFNDENDIALMSNNSAKMDDIFDELDDLKTTTTNGEHESSASSYVIDLRKLESAQAMKIIDIEFLYGYYEPTLFILYESNRTWVGRYAVKKDTCNSISLSINLNQKTNPEIWPVDKLPSDCLKALAVPQPIGGVLIFTVNGLIYINQSVPSYGVSLNSIAKGTTKYPLKNMEHVKITMDCSYTSFISTDQLIVSLKGGELYIITLLTDTDSLRSVRGFHVEKGPGSVIASCLIRCFDNYLFIGSRLGNSVLLKYNAKTSVLDADEEAQLAIEESKRQMEKQRNDELDDLDHILDLNSEMTDQVNTNIISYQFEICDILLNIAPCGHTIIGESQNNYADYLKQQASAEPEVDEANDQNDETQPQAKPKTQTQQRVNFNLIDLVTTSGHAKNGSISILQRSLRPEIMVSFEIENIIDMWSVFSCYEGEGAPSSDNPLASTYLFLTKLDSTMILQIANEITELDRELFCTRQPTINVANINANLEVLTSQNNDMFLNEEFKLNRFILQVTTTDLYVCNEVEQLFTYSFSGDFKSQIKCCMIQDPFIVIQTEAAELFVYLLYENEGRFTVHLIDRDIYKSELTKIQCFTVYKDTNGLFDSLKPSETSRGDVNELEDKFKKNSLSAMQTSTSMSMTVDDEDELLYGTSLSNDAFKEPLPQPPQQSKSEEQVNKRALKKEPSYWLFTVTSENSCLNIYNMSLVPHDNGRQVDVSLTVHFTLAKFSMVPKLLVNQLSMRPSMVHQMSETSANTQRASSLVVDPLAQATVNEIIMIALGNDKTKPYLVAHVDEEIVIYEAFQCKAATEQLNLRFKRISHNALIRDRRRRRMQIKNKLLNLNSQTSVMEPMTQQQELNPEVPVQRTKLVPLIRPFENIAGYNGFFINSLHPYFVFQCTRSGLTTHPLWFDGPINSFVPLKNSSITLSGFIYLNKKNDIRICTLPLDDCNGKVPIYYDSEWVLRKIQLRQTVHFIIYHDESKTYACITSTSEPTNQLMQLGGEDKELESYPRDENFILPQREQFTMQLYTSSTWEPLPLGKFVLGEWEHVSSLKLISLPYEGHSSGFRSFIVASTANCYNEDVNSRGRILIFDIVEVEPEPGQPLTAIKMKKIYDKEQKGPVTCIESVCGNLVGAVGQKIYLWEFKNGELIGRAFVDIHFYVHKMVTLKNLVLIADVHRSISLLRFQDDYKKLSFVAKDKRIIDTFTCEYLIDNTSVSFLATDSDRNLANYMYTNESHDNQGGQWLVRKGEFNIGSHVNSMFRLKCNVSDPNVDKRSSLADKRQVTYFSTLDGSLGYVIPITEKTFRRLFMLQNALSAMISHLASLNPKAYRAFRSRRKELANPQKNILDGDLLFKFFDLSFNDRNDISRKIKSSTEQILDDLIDVYQYTEHF